MAWILNTPSSFIETIAIKVLKCGPIPQHIAFIMDGNRRYATKQNVEKAEGHSQGFHKLAETLEWCLKIGVKEVTVYAFSIENFKRSREEVDTLMKLAREKFVQLINEKDKLMEKGVRIRVFGKLSLLPKDIRASIAKVMSMTKNNTECFLNVAFAYTGREDITSSIQTIIKGENESNFNLENIDSKLISQCLYSSGSPDPDILIRTSGEIRLSDFLLWQLSSTNIHLTDILWPEFKIWHLLIAVFYYQRNYHFFNSIKFSAERIIDKHCCFRDTDREFFLKHVEYERFERLKQYENDGDKS